MYPFGPAVPPERRDTEPEQAEEPLDAEDEISSFIGDPVLRHRAERMANAGLNPRQARTLALDRRVDLHFVTDTLIGRGCDPDIAFDIASH